MSLAAIHILKKELALTDADYRALLREVAGVSSAKDLDADGDRAVMARLYAIRDQRHQASFDAPKSPQEKKIYALWYELKGYLPIQEQTHAYLLGLCRRAANAEAIQTLADLTKPESHKAIEALKKRLDQEQKSLNDVPF